MKVTIRDVAVKIGTAEVIETKAEITGPDENEDCAAGCVLIEIQCPTRR